MAAPKPDHLLIAFAYDGAPFHGVWPQPDVPTVGVTLLERLEAALGRRPEMFVPTARTDTGVHARVNLATVRLWHGADTAGLRDAERERPDGLGAVRIHRVGAHVYARGLAHRKRYVYAWDDDLDVHAMRRAAADLCGTHDLSALRGRRVRPERCVDLTLDRVEVRETLDGPILLVEAARFVRWQVRKMAALLAAIGRGERTPDDIPAILASRDPRQAEPPAPGTGLTLAGLELDGSHGPAWVTSVEEVELEGISAG